MVLLGDARTSEDLGRDFGDGLHARKIDYLVADEWASSAEDILFRRSKLGLHAPAGTAEAIGAYLANPLAARSRSAPQILRLR